ncbi:hypothetical protein ACJMK2_011506 [Sinanodonta woodiana]|uniref:Peptidase metallopeptidase domain-containing protein n=1 Tax=Sinanodonta woodiana TaxID=1069815 RepID=A0ABD3V5C5_SINWO
MVHIPLTGQFDKETLRKIAMPRCGVKDVPDNVPVNSFGERIWTQKVLSWKITGYSKTSRLKRFQQRDALKRAFNIWARETPLHFEYKERGPTDMSIKFSTWDYRDGYPFDGPDGNIHFDDHENWLLGAKAEKKGPELYQVAAHEIVPYYSYSSFPMLNSCDIDNIQKLYGKPPNEQNNDWWFLRNDPFSS